MSSLKNKIYQRALGRAGSTQEVQLSLTELLYYLWKRGGMASLRGLIKQLRFKSCAGRLFIGKGTDILFPRYIALGKNVYLGDYLYLNGFSREGFHFGNNVRIREYGWIQATSSLAHPGKGMTVDDNVYIGPRCYLGAGGGITIGKNVTMGAEVSLLAENHSFEDADVLINEQGVTSRGIIIEDDVWIGNRVIILDGVRVAQGAVIGAGAVVTKDVPQLSVVVGNPARVVKTRKHKSEFSEIATVLSKG